MFFWNFDMNLNTLASKLETGVSTAEIIYNAVEKKLETPCSPNDLREYLKDYTRKCVNVGVLVTTEENIKDTINYIVSKYEMRLNQIPKIS